MEVSVAELRRLSNVLFDHLEQTGHEVIEIPHDFYWQVAASERYDLTKEPGELTVGQLSDDWEFLRNLGDGEPVSYGLVWLAAILRVIGEEVVA